MNINTFIKIYFIKQKLNKYYSTLTVKIDSFKRTARSCEKTNFMKKLYFSRNKNKLTNYAFFPLKNKHRFEKIIKENFACLSELFLCKNINFTRFFIFFCFKINTSPCRTVKRLVFLNVLEELCCKQ